MININTRNYISRTTVYTIYNKDKHPQEQPQQDKLYVGFIIENNAILK